MVVVGSVSTITSKSCAVCCKVAALHDDMIHRRFPKEVTIALDEAAKDGYYALPTRAYDPRASKYDPAIDREGETWLDDGENEDSDDIPEYAREELGARHAEAMACVVECTKMSRAVARFVERKNVNTKLGRVKGTSIQKKRKGSGAVAAAVASKPKKNKSGGDGTVSGLLGRGKAKASKPGKEKPQGVGIGLLGRGKGRK